MSTLRIISNDTIQATNHGDLSQKIDLTPSDLKSLHIEAIQHGLLFHKPETQDISNQIQHLKHSFSTTLSFFPPLAGRLVIKQHEDHTCSAFIACNNIGALFVHAAAENTSIADILQPTYIPPFVYSFFPLNGVKNHEGTSQPLLAVQVTELTDGIFIACTISHVVADGKSFWHFFNSWAEISRGLDKPTKLPALDRWFLDGIDRPIRFPFTNEEKLLHESIKPQLPPPARIFHFSKEKIAKLKSKANGQAGTDKISSLQALLTHLWCSVIHSQRLDPREETRYRMAIDVRRKISPQLPENYFGNALTAGSVTMKTEELMNGGLGKGAWEMNKMILLRSRDDMIKSEIESWMKSPFFKRMALLASPKFLVNANSPRFNIYCNDFGWGKPLAVRNGAANKISGKFTLYAGAEEGSIDIDVCLPIEFLKAMGNDPEIVDAMSI